MTHAHVVQGASAKTDFVCRGIHPVYCKVLKMLDQVFMTGWLILQISTAPAGPCNNHRKDNNTL